MFTQKLRKQGDRFAVTIPKDVVERQQLYEGMLLLIDVQPAEIRPMLTPEVREAFAESWAQNETGYRHLAQR